MTMKCEDVIERLIEAGNTEDEVTARKLAQHLEQCESCRDAIRGADAMRMLKNRPTLRAPEGFFRRTMAQVASQAQPAASGSRFWTGAAVGGLLAASVVIALFSFGILNVQPDTVDVPAAVSMALGEQQDVSIAIDAERDLPNTMVSVKLSGGFEIVGFGEQKELTWSIDLEKGVNKLTLPLSAVGAAGGQLVVRLEHEGTQREFRVNLNITG
jgi:hypothetical protein